MKKKIQILHADKRAEEELAFRNIILSAQLETSIDGILVVDANNKIILYNHQFVEMTGIPRELIEIKNDEAVLRLVTDQIADPQQFLARIHYLYEHKRETSHDEINFRDGRIFDRYSSPMFGPGDHYYGRVWYLRDVTKWRRAEEELKKSETLFRSYFELPIAGIAITSPTKNWLEVNDHLCEMLGYKREELLQTTWSELTYPDELDLDVDNFNRVIKGEIDGYSIDKRFVHKDGHIIWTSLFVNCVRAADGIVDYFVATLFDISERKLAEDLIRESEERFRLVFDNVFDGISIYEEDPDPFKRKLIECNAQYAVMAGRTREELLRIGNTQALQITSEDTANKVRLESLSGNIEFRGSFSWIRPDGKENLIEYIGMPVVWRGKSYSIGIDRDVTIHRQTEEALEQRVIERTKELQSVNNELEAFSYSVSHDLRAPLRALDGFAGILLEDYAASLDEEGNRLLRVITDNAKKMGNLIDDLLSFSRLNRQEVTFLEIDMHALANSVYAELITNADKEKIKYFLHDIPHAYGDPSMIRQVWVNLISNAIKFSSRKPGQIIEIGYITEGADNIYYVKDNGAGFDMAHSGKLFGVFQRLHSLKDFDGTGVGLAIVQRIVHRLNGRIWAEGKVNEGATFYFTLPNQNIYQNGNELP